MQYDDKANQFQQSGWTKNGVPGRSDPFRLQVAQETENFLARSCEFDQALMAILSGAMTFFDPAVGDFTSQERILFSEYLSDAGQVYFDLHIPQVTEDFRQAPLGGRRLTLPIIY